MEAIKQLLIASDITGITLGKICNYFRCISLNIPVSKLQATTSVSTGPSCFVTTFSASRTGRFGLSLTNRNKYEICQTTFVLIPVTVSKNL
jgi:hypothetical protein